MSVSLFSIVYRPGIGESPVALICQAVDVANEKFLWVDGINAEDPVMVSISAVKHIEYMGTFKDFLAARMDLAEKVIAESLGEHSPTLAARAVLFMARDRNLSARDALELVESQALDILETDDKSFDAFGVAVRSFAPSTAV